MDDFDDSNRSAVEITTDLPQYTIYLDGRTLAMIDYNSNVNSQLQL